MAELEDRLRAYGTVLDRTAASEADSGGPPTVGCLSLVSDDPSPPRRGRAALVGVAAAVSVLVGAGVLISGGVADDPAGLRPAAPGDASPLPLHRDLDGCTRGGSAPGTDEEAYQARWKACVAALAGDVVAAGVIGGVPWELLATDEPPLESAPPGGSTGHWVTLRATGLDGVFRGSYGDTGTPAGTGNIFSQVGPCCRLGDATVVVAVTRADVVRVRLELDGLSVAEVATVTDPATPWIRYAILGAPATGTAQVVFVTANGTTVRPLTSTLDLATTGG